ncbi:MAG: NADH-quinone oxidoreductase subunit L [Acidobacteria bacterium]|nr:NADH-quinone oxidoreductase subunit L [Acidobacteriota bacterium]MYK79405.1 NADH-quinone oxidoreductase subunit L [Acidobacteriota bacterium]
MNSLLWLIPVLPGVGAAINGLFGKRLGKRLSGLLACGSVAASFLIALGFFFTVFLAEGGASARVEQSLFSWIPSMGVDWAYRLDSLSMVMTLVVTGIGLLIHIYSLGYMSHDGGFSRFFSYLNLFTFFMLNLVLGANMLLLFIGWEGVGLCSYLLIGFWFERPAAAAAGKKAFIVNRIGDAGFIMAVFLTFVTFGTLDFYGVMGQISASEMHGGVLTAIGVLLFVGAAGKSAQIPLYVWLPDAMEGPTPVSALIHAATMVTAGVYMVARSGVLFSHAPAAMALVATIGALTAIFAASIALFQNDIKRVLAYSTVSQLGYMFLGAGVGAFAAAIFHLMTHAFFKACLFLGSGSVIHTMEHAEHASGGHRHYTEMQDMRNMGGLARYMPRTAYTFMIATVAIAGIPPLAGFFSKDEILWKTFEGGHFALWALAAAAAAMTAFYMSRQVIMTFWGDFRGGAAMEKHLHESAPSMTVPLIILAAGSVVAGFVGVPAALGGANRIEHFLEPAIYAGGHGPAPIPHASYAVEYALMALSVALAAAGIFYAYRRYWAGPTRDSALAGSRAYRTLLNKYYVDEIYDATAVQGTVRGGEGLFRFDQKVVDGAVNGSASLTRLSGDLSDLSDQNLVDRAVNLVAEILAAASTRFRRLQTGLFQNYALLMLFAVVLLAGALTLWS